MAPDEVNTVAHERLAERLKDLGATYLAATGGDVEWTHIEPGFAVVGMTAEDARALGREFGQEAIFGWSPTALVVLSCDTSNIHMTLSAEDRSTLRRTRRRVTIFEPASWSNPTQTNREENCNAPASTVGDMTSTRADWSRLTDWLAEHSEAMVVIPWSVLDAIVGGLPDSATKHYPQWWYGDRPNTRAWRRAGYELVQVDLGRTVTLRKSTRSGNSPKVNRAGPPPSTAGSTEHAQSRKSGGIGLETIDPLSALILLPCSASKASGGSSRTVAPPSPWAPELHQARIRLQDAARLDERQVMPAWQRYTGGFYQSAGSSLADAVSAGAHVAILSGGYGVVRADEVIGMYDKELKPADWPGDVLEDALVSEAVRVGAQHVVAFAAATTSYARIIRRTPWRSAGVQRAVLVTIVSHGGGAMVKVPRDLGAAFRAFWYRLADAYPAGMQVEELA